MILVQAMSAMTPLIRVETDAETDRGARRGFDGGDGQRLGHERGGEPGRDRERRFEAAAGEVLPQPLPAPGEPALDGPDGAAELLRRGIVGQAAEVAEHDRRAERLGEPGELLVDHREQLPARRPHRPGPALPVPAVDSAPLAGRAAGRRGPVPWRRRAG